MAPDTVFEHLTQVLQKENLVADPMALKLLARAARGSMRDALSLTDQAIAFGSGQLQEATVRLMLGSVDTSHVLGFIDALARGNGADVVAIAETLRFNGLSAATALEDMAMVLQRMAVMQAVPESAQTSDDPDHQALRRLSQTLPADETQLLYSICLHGRAELGLAPDEYAGLTMVLLRLLAFKPPAPSTHQGQTPSAQKKTLTAPQTESARPAELLQAAKEVAPAKIPPRVQVKSLPVREASEPVDKTTPRILVQSEEGHFWTDTVRALVKGDVITALVRELALQSQLIARDSDQWHLRIESESLNQGTARERLQTALNAAGHAVKLVVEIGKVSDSPALRNAAAQLEKQKAAEDLIHADPLVQSMIQDFGAKIVPGSIKLISSIS
jgi:DNA polymerase-3 subunit gamma/tau